MIIESFMNQITKKLGKCIRYHRKAGKLTQLELAKFAGVGKTVIYDLEHGKISVQLDTLIKILNVLNITLQLQSPLMDNFTKIEKNNEDS